MTTPAVKDSVGEGHLVIFCLGSRCKVEACEVRDAGGAERGAVQPGVGADEVDGGGGQDAGEVGLVLPVIGGAPQPGGADGLGDCALDAGADVVAGLPFGGLLLGALPGEELVLLAGQQGQAASPPAVCRLRALRPQRARVAVGEREVDPGDGGAAGLALVGPADAGRTLGAGDLPCVPVDAEGGLGQGGLLAGAAADLGGVSYVRIQVLANTGALDRDQQLSVVRELTDLVATAAADPALAARTWVLLTEAPDGGWGLQGHANINAELVAAARSQIADLRSAAKPPS